MSQSEQYGNEVIIYYVAFTSQKSKEKPVCKHYRLFAFRRPLHEEKVAEFVKTYLTNIIEITSVKEFFKGALLENKV